MTTLSMKVHQLRVGDVLVGSGVTVLHAPSEGVHTPSGKVDLWITDRRGQSRSATWGKHTVVRVERPDWTPPREYTNGPIPTRDVAGEWDRRDEEGPDA